MIDLTDPFIVRNLTYGIEDSLLSTSGTIIGVAIAGFSNKSVVTTGTILVLVEALSMSFGSFLSEDNFIKTANLKYTSKQIMTYSLVMFVSYLIAGFLVLSPFILNLSNPVLWTIILALFNIFYIVYVFQKEIKKSTLQTIIASVILFISVETGRYLKF